MDVSNHTCRLVAAICCRSIGRVAGLRSSADAPAAADLTVGWRFARRPAGGVQRILGHQLGISAFSHAEEAQPQTRLLGPAGEQPAGARRLIGVAACILRRSDKLSSRITRCTATAVRPEAALPGKRARGAHKADCGLCS